MAYNGHKNWNHWNVALWIGNDEGLYRLACESLGRSGRRSLAEAVRRFRGTLEDLDVTRTPDGAPYSQSAVRAALAGLRD